MIGLNKIGLNQVQLNQLYLNTLCACQKSSGGDGFPRLPGDVTRWSFKGLTNEMMSKNPRLEDADHKGRFLTFKNFSWGEMSGCGGYDYDFTKKSILNYSGANVNAKISSDTLYIEKVDNSRVNVVIKLAQFKCRLKITGVSDSINSGEIRLLRMYSSKDFDNRITINTDGIYDVDIPNQEDGLIYIFAVSSQGTIENPLTLTTPITIEQLSLYPDALVFDGVDDYGICENFPILTEEKGYTVVALRQWIEEKNDSTALVSNCKNWGQDGAFLFEYNNLRINFLNVAISFGHVSSVDRGKSPFSYQTSKLYNGKNIEPGSFIGSNELVVGKGNKDFPTVSKVAIWELIIIDHDATEEELTKIKNYFVKTYPWLFFDQAWTVVGKSNEDIDRATIANITGNGNNLVLLNFGFAENSGYGEYAYNWNTWKINKVDSTKSNVCHDRMEITLPAIGESLRTQCNFYSPLCKVGTIYDFSFKISGLTDNSVVLVKPGTNGGGAIIAQYNKDGVYHLNYTLTDEAIIDESTQNRIYFFVQNFSDEEMNLTVEQIPNHGSYLVTDGVDDKVYSSAFTLGKKFTVVGEWIFIKPEQVYNLAGIVKDPSFYLYNYQAGTNAYIRSPLGTLIQGEYAVKAIQSSNIVYLNNWNERELNTEQNQVDKGRPFIIGWNGTSFTRLAFKNAAIYGKELSKEDAIKAYIYLQTLKAK